MCGKYNGKWLRKLRRRLDYTEFEEVLKVIESGRELLHLYVLTPRRVAYGEIYRTDYFYDERVRKTLSEHWYKEVEAVVERLTSALLFLGEYGEK